MEVLHQPEVKRKFHSCQTNASKRDTQQDAASCILEKIHFRLVKKESLFISQSVFHAKNVFQYQFPKQKCGFQTDLQNAL